MNRNNFFNELFMMSKSERNGSLVLLFILILLILIRMFLPFIIKEDDSYINAIIQKNAYLEQQNDSLRNLYSMQVSDVRINEEINGEFRQDIHEPYQLFHFDPNTINADSLRLLGVNERAVKTLVNYRSKGGRFYKPDDLLKIYGIDSMLVNRLMPFMAINDSNNRKPKEPILPSKTKTKDFAIEINSSDSATFTLLPGVGPVFAGRICKFREYLGGFVHIGQLKEVYNFPEETYTNIEKYLKVNDSLVVKMNINFVDVDNLKKHPYCNYETARRIIDYRATNGPFVSVKQLSDTLLSPDEFSRLEPYLTVY